jgi:hypothetical protein
VTRLGPLLDFAQLGQGWGFILGSVLGGAAGTQFGRWSVYVFMRNPLGWLVRQFRLLLAEIGRLYAANADVIDRSSASASGRPSSAGRRPPAHARSR